ncbi:regulatory protein, Fis family [Neorhodopirellula lusitana]|uniref:Regulatory protein, Fis family n=1 Tax=Neorhodopirellula lusitana TaxID=445327 RepID=A0ABY1QNX7_9BACT|nr:helix-turn-helix domain-containing protein [Neorhodopirellula lusitana]SMP73816.1 regulatory protein, Fis family [Neorhodopirellula lusitana]
MTDRFLDRFLWHASMQPRDDLSSTPSSRSSSPESRGRESLTLDPWQEELIEEIRQRFTGGSQTILEDIHERVDRVLIDFVLTQTGGNISEASSRLGISRPTLRNRLRQLRLNT